MFEPMPTLAVALSPSLSVIVATSWIEPSAMVADAWSGPVSGLCWIARTWSSVTTPLVSTVTLNAAVPNGSATPPEPTRPTTPPEPLLYR
jgi:hypothetical protein